MQCLFINVTHLCFAQSSIYDHFCKQPTICLQSITTALRERLLSRSALISTVKLFKRLISSQIHHCASLGLWHWCHKEARINQPNRSHAFLFNPVPQWICFFPLLLCFIVQKAPSKMTLDIYVNRALFWLCFSKHILYLLQETPRQENSLHAPSGLHC